jgi:hypothetical protein
MKTSRSEETVYRIWNTNMAGESCPDSPDDLVLDDEDRSFDGDQVHPSACRSVAVAYDNVTDYIETIKQRYGINLTQEHVTESLLLQNSRSTRADNVGAVRESSMADTVITTNSEEIDEEGALNPTPVRGTEDAESNNVEVMDSPHLEGRQVSAVHRDLIRATVAMIVAVILFVSSLVAGFATFAVGSVGMVLGAAYSFSFWRKLIRLLGPPDETAIA